MVWPQFCGKPRLYLVTEEAQGQSQSKSEGETQKERRKDGLGRVVGEVYPTKKLEELIDKQLERGVEHVQPTTNDQMAVYLISEAESDWETVSLYFGELNLR